MNMDCAAMFLHDLFGYPKAKAVSGGSLGCKKRLEDAWENAGFNTLAGVRHCNSNYRLATLSASRIRGSQPDGTVGRHRVKTVCQQVPEDLQQLTRYRFHS
jgi:hypothetical protein